MYNPRDHMCFIYISQHPESFAKLRQRFYYYYFFMRAKTIQIALKVGHHWPASKNPFKWRFPDGNGSMMAQH